MLVDLSLNVTKFIRKEATYNLKKASFGHLGTHFDVMNKTFPLSYVKREGIVFDVSDIEDRDIDFGDVDVSAVKENMFVAFYSGFIDKVQYGTKGYYAEHPQLSDRLIDKLLEQKISIIGIDFAGVRRGKEHTPKDQYCADKGVFIVENLCNLEKILRNKKQNYFYANTYPINFSDMTGLPCRVIAEI
ncbi:MAG: cyclase family protein [Desulfobacterales bacterium]